MSDRDKLIELLATEVECNKSGRGDCSLCEYRYADDKCVRHISEITADYLLANDMAQVVRCKDCKYGKSLDRTKSPFKYYKDSCVMCTCEDVVGDEPMVYLPNHFCSYGESNG